MKILGKNLLIRGSGKTYQFALKTAALLDGNMPSRRCEFIRYIKWQE